MAYLLPRQSQQHAPAGIVPARPPPLGVLQILPALAQAAAEQAPVQDGHRLVIPALPPVSGLHFPATPPQRPVCFARERLQATSLPSRGKRCLRVPSADFPLWLGFRSAWASAQDGGFPAANNKAGLLAPSYPC